MPHGSRILIFEVRRHVHEQPITRIAEVTVVLSVMNLTIYMVTLMPMGLGLFMLVSDGIH